MIRRISIQCPTHGGLWASSTIPPWWTKIRGVLLQSPAVGRSVPDIIQVIADANRRGVFQGKVMDEVFQKMEGGNAAIATYYAGDYLSMVENQADGVDLAFVIPEEGSNWFVDAMCVL